MPRFRKSSERRRRSTWRQALVFNGLLLLLPILSARLLISAHAGGDLGNVVDRQARAETRIEIDANLAALVPPNISRRTFWSERINRELAASDYTAARGYLLAAPVMLDRADARAVLAAADAEERGNEDERLTQASLLFLPNELRASYQRATEPARLEMDVPPLVRDNADNEPESDDGQTQVSQSSPTADSEGPLPFRGDVEPAFKGIAQSPILSMLGDEQDLARRSQRWLNGERIDSYQLRLTGVGLIAWRANRADNTLAQAVSVLREARREDRLTPFYNSYLERRLDAIMPESTLRKELRSLFQTTETPELLADRVLAAYQTAEMPGGMQRLTRDFESVANIARQTSPSGAITLMEQAETPEDVRRLNLLAEAGGDRSVALSKQIGRDILGLAQVGMRWSRAMTYQLYLIIAIGLILIGMVLVGVLFAPRSRLKRR